MVDTKAFLKGMAGFSVVPVFAAFVTIFVIPAVSNMFPPDEYGKINIFYSTGAVLASGVMLGLDNSQIRYYFEPPKGMTRKSLAPFALLVGVIIIFVILLIVMCTSSDPVSRLLFGDNNPNAIWLLAVYVLFLCVLRVLNTNARMDNDAKLYNCQSIAQCVVTRVSYILVAIWSTYYYYSIIAMTVGMALVAVVSLLVQRHSISFSDTKLSSSSVKRLLAFGIPTMLTGFVLNLNASVGKIILGAYGLFDAAGILAIAATLANVFTVIPNAFNTFWSPFMYKNYRDEQPFITKVHDYVMLGAFAIVVIIILCQDLLFLIVGKEYASCKIFFMLIMLNPIQSLICETTAYGIVLRERPIWNTVISVLGAVSCAAITIFLVPKLGIYAAAIGLAVSSLLIGFSRSVFGQRFYKSVASPIRSIFVSLIIVFLCILNCWMSYIWLLRILVCGISLLLMVVLYKTQLIYIFSKIRDYFTRIRDRRG